MTFRFDFLQSSPFCPSLSASVETLIQLCNRFALAFQRPTLQLYMSIFRLSRRVTMDYMNKANYLTCAHILTAWGHSSNYLNLLFDSRRAVSQD